MLHFLKRPLTFEPNVSDNKWADVKRRINRKETFFVCSMAIAIATAFIVIALLMGITITFTNIMFIYVLMGLLLIPPIDMILNG